MKKRVKGKIFATSVIVVGIGGLFLYFLLQGFYRGHDKSDEGGNILENVVGNWTEVNGARYYLDLNGNKLTGEQLIDDLVYCFDNSGVWNGEEPIPKAVISVQQSTEQMAHVSLTGGVTWLSDEEPEYYMTTGKSSYPKDIGAIVVTIHNNSNHRLMMGVGFTLLIWNGNEWVSSPADGLSHNDEGYQVQPDGTLDMICDFQNKPLEVGRYKLIKEIQQPDDKSVKLVFSVEFELT